MKTQRIWFIYSLTDPRDDAVRYIGWTYHTTRRLDAHCRSAKRTHTHKAHWIRQLLTAGHIPVLTILESGTGDWANSERQWIAHFRAAGAYLTNATDGGEGTPGLIPNEQTKAKMSDAHRGKKQSPESIAKTRAALIGRKQSKEHTAALSVKRKGRIPIAATTAAAIANRGRKQTAEHIAKRVASHIGRPKLKQRKLNADQVREIRALRGKVSQRTLAKRFGIGPTAIHEIQNRNCYADIPD